MAENSFLIEIGGSFTTIYKKNGGLVLKERSILAITNKDGKTVIKAFGVEADKLERIDDPDIIVFSPFGEGIIKNMDYAKLLMAHFLKKAGIKKSIFSSFSCYVATPCGLRDSDKKDYENLLYSCDIENIVFVPSLYLIALKNGIKKFSKNNLVVDMGGSTIDVGIVDFEGLRFGATLPIGSRNINATLVEILQNKYKVEIPLFLAEDIKIELASLFSNDISSMKIQIYEPNIDSTITTMVYANDVREAILPYLDETVRLIETTLNMLTVEELKWVKQNGIFVTGGMAKISGLEEYLKSKLTLPIRIDDDCENSVILGGAKLLSNKELLKILK